MLKFKIVQAAVTQLAFSNRRARKSRENSAAAFINASVNIIPKEYGCKLFWDCD